MANKNKNKGKRVESEVAEIFSKSTGTNFQRIPNSGAFIGGKNSVRINTLTDSQVLLSKGDIIPGEGYEDCYIEVKGRVEFAYHQLFEKNKELESWIDQCLVDYDKVGGKVLIIVFKINRHGYFSVTPKKQFKFKNNNFLVYYYRDMEWVIESFGQQWVTDRDHEIKTLCSKK